MKEKSMADLEKFFKYIKFKNTESFIQYCVTIAEHFEVSPTTIIGLKYASAEVEDKKPIKLYTMNGESRYAYGSEAENLINGVWVL